jgi:hypothetical protein
MGIGWVEHWSSALGANPEIRRVGPLRAVAKLKKIGKAKQTAEPSAIMRRVVDCSER